MGRGREALRRASRAGASATSRRSRTARRRATSASRTATQVTLKLFADPTPWLHVSRERAPLGSRGPTASARRQRGALARRDLGDAASAPGRAVPVVVDGRAVPDGPAALDHTLSSAPTSSSRTRAGARLWLAYGQLPDRRAGVGPLRPRASTTGSPSSCCRGGSRRPSSRPSTSRVRANGLGTYDDDARLPARHPLRRALGYNMRALDAYAVVARLAARSLGHAARPVQLPGHRARATASRALRATRPTTPTTSPRSSSGSASDARLACARRVLGVAARGAGSRAAAARSRGRVALDVAGARLADVGPVVVYLEAAAARRRSPERPPGAPPAATRASRPRFLAIAAGQTGRDAERRRHLPQRVLVLDAERLRPRPLSGRASRERSPSGTRASCKVYCSIHECDERDDLRRAVALLRGRGRRAAASRSATSRRAATGCAPGAEKLPASERPVDVGAGVTSIDVHLGDATPR